MEIPVGVFNRPAVYLNPRLDPMHTVHSLGAQPWLQPEPLICKQNPLKDNTEAKTEQEEDVFADDEMPGFWILITETFTWRLP